MSLQFQPRSTIYKDSYTFLVSKIPIFLTFFLSLVIVFLVKKGLSYWNAIQSIQNLHGSRLLIAPESIWAMVLRQIPGLKSISGLTLSNNFIFEWKHDPYAEDGWDVRSIVSILPETNICILVADPAIAKEVTASRTQFPKPVHLYDSLTFFGHNIIASEGDQWKKYRKICAPAFSERNDKMVWEETVKVMNGLFNEVWKDDKSVTLNHCLDITYPIALFIISAAAFGQSISWADNGVIPSGHQMSFKDAVNVMSKDFLIPAVMPKWAMGVSKRTKTAGQALIEIQKYMSEMIRERHHSEKVERNDLFTSLLDANYQGFDNTGILTEEELIGNVFVFLLAGHETTAHTLAFAFGLLALYPDEQEKLHQHIASVLNDDRDPTYEDMSSLTHSMAVFLEALRLFPPVTGFPKISAEDTVLTTRNPDGAVKSVPVPKGSYIAICSTAIHYNPRYWSDPKAFQPSRFLKSDWPKEAFLPFGTGPRACLGRRFSETEGVAILTMLVQKYKITVKEEPQFANETFEQRKSRILDTEIFITLTPVRVPLVFTRR